ncbi:MAG: polyhydroxyalkanoate synthase [Polyangiales bacterium]
MSGFLTLYFGVAGGVLAWIAVGLVVALVCFWLHLWFWGRRLHVEMKYDFFERRSASDGGLYELRRINERAIGTPVLLVHGIAVNHRSVDALPEVSMARQLESEGHDVWLLTLRSGVSAAWWETLLRRRRSLRFEAMALYDLPEAVDRICALTQEPSVDYVGYSMGGMLLYGALAAGALSNEQVRHAVLIGSPGRVESPLAGIRILARVPRWCVPRLPLKLYSRALAFAADFVETPLHRLLANPRHLGPGFAARAMINMVEDIPASLAADFARWIAGDGALTLQTGDAVLAGLAHTTIPALFIAGAADHIAPPESVRAAFEAWGCDVGTPKRFILLDEVDTPYGHTDLVLGISAARDVFQLVAGHIRPGFRTPTDM